MVQARDGQGAYGLMLTVITGPMFSGKSTALISKCTSHAIAGNLALVFKPSNDNRYDKFKIVTHDAIELSSIPINKDNPHSCIEYINWCVPKPIDVVAFDEVQFFDKKRFIELVDELLYTKGFQIICAGLAQDSFGKPFGAMPYLLSIADRIISLKAVCAKCKSINAATRTYRKVKSHSQIVVGGIDEFEPRCFECWNEI